MLLALRDRYAEDADLEWSADTPITEWEDIVVEDFVLTELAQLPRLKVLFLKNNELTGTFPTELLAMTNLTGLSLSQNELTGGVPPELGKLANLEELVLHNNSLTGPIPPELGQLSNLKTLWLNINELTGEIPVELTGLANHLPHRRPRPGAARYLQRPGPAGGYAGEPGPGGGSFPGFLGRPRSAGRGSGDRGLPLPPAVPRRRANEAAPLPRVARPAAAAGNDQ